MRKYEILQLKVLFLSQNDVITASGDGEPIPPKGNEGLWEDFYN